MKTRFLTVIGIISVILVAGFFSLAFLNLSLYKTWANNEHWYYHPDGYNVECEIQFFQSPGICHAFDEHGTIVDTKLGLGNWENRR